MDFILQILQRLDAHERIADIATVREWFPILVTLYCFYDIR